MLTRIPRITLEYSLNREEKSLFMAEGMCDIVDTVGLIYGPTLDEKGEENRAGEIVERSIIIRHTSDFGVNDHYYIVWFKSLDLILLFEASLLKRDIKTILQLLDKVIAYGTDALDIKEFIGKFPFAQAKVFQDDQEIKFSMLQTNLFNRLHQTTLTDCNVFACRKS